jgi:V-type H+-transporting ATPase subunit d
MKEKLYHEIQHLLAHAVYPLNQFLHMMLHKYQIENVVFIIEGLKGQRSMEELMRTADPLGFFPELKNIQPIEGDDYASLYQAVLVDLPVGVYFRKFLNEVTAGVVREDGQDVDTKYISEVMKDYSLQQIQLRVKKIWLHEFYEFCTTKLNEKSVEIMGDLLKFESDMMTIQVIENSRNYSQLVSARGREAERKKYISKVGYLYPDRSDRLSNVQDFKSLVAALEASPYEAMLKQVSANDENRNEAENNGVTIGKFLFSCELTRSDEVMLVESSRRFSVAFEDGFHYGCFYAYLKLKE